MRWRGIWLPRYLARVIVTNFVYPHLVEFLHFDIQSTGQKSLCVNTFWGHHKALFLLNSRIPRVRFSSELTVNHARKGRNHPCRSHKDFNGPLVTSQSKEIDIFTARPLRPVLRANPFPEVTDLICRIPLSTLFYRPEAANLGDLMRLWVRSIAKLPLPRIFKGRHERTWQLLEWAALPDIWP